MKEQYIYIYYTHLYQLNRQVFLVEDFWSHLLVIKILVPLIFGLAFLRGHQAGNYLQRCYQKLWTKYYSWYRCHVRSSSSLVQPQVHSQGQIQALQVDRSIQLSRRFRRWRTQCLLSSRSQRRRRILFSNRIHSSVGRIVGLDVNVYNTCKCLLITLDSFLIIDLLKARIFACQSWI